MTDLLHILSARLRKFVGNRRNVARQRVSIPCSVSVFEDRDEKSVSAGLLGKTIDMSYSGLAFLVPAIRIGHRYIAGEDRTLRIMLELPNAQVESYAIAKRYNRLDEPHSDKGSDASDKGYVVGALITRMSDSDRELFTDYLESLQRKTIGD